MKKINEFLTKLFGKRKERNPDIGKCFKQECVFADSELEGDKRIFPMQSGKIYLAELIEINNPYGGSADDTGQRDLVWKVLDTIQVKESFENDTKTIISPLYGKIKLTAQEIIKDARNNMETWEKINNMFIEKYFPKQNEGFRFLRGG